MSRNWSWRHPSSREPRASTWWTSKPECAAIPAQDLEPQEFLLLDPAYPVSSKACPLWVDPDWLAFLDQAEALAFAKQTSKHYWMVRPQARWPAGTPIGVRQGRTAPVADYHL